MPATDYQITGPIADLVPYPVLQYILTSDPVLGTSDVTIPDGPFNRELNKLLQNIGSVGNLLVGYLNRTVGAVESQMPDPYVVPSPVPGASLTPAHLDYHTLFYTDREVLLRYDALSVSPGWKYQIDVAKVNQVLTRTSETVTVDLGIEDDDVTVEIPAGYSIAHLKSFYVVYSSDPNNTPLISVLPGIYNNSNVIRFTLSTTPALPDTYQLVCLFEKFASA